MKLNQREVASSTTSSEESQPGHSEDEFSRIEEPPKFYVPVVRDKRRKPRESFNKANALIHNKPQRMLTVTQQKLINVLLRHAQSNPPNKDGMWTIQNRDLIKNLHIQTRNTAFISKTIDAMQSIKVQWDSLEERGLAKNYAVVFPYAKTLGPETTFEIQQTVLQLLDITKTSYTRLDLMEISKLSRVCSVPVYEIATRYAGLGASRWFAWEDFRDMIISSDVIPDKAKNWSSFNRDYLTPAIKNINASTPLNIQLETQKNGTNVTQMRLVIHRRSSSLDAMNAITTRDEKNTLYQALKGLGVPERTATKLIATYDKEAVEGAILHTQWRKQAKRLKPLNHADKYLANSLKHNLWKEFLQERKKYGQSELLLDNSDEPTEASPRDEQQQEKGRKHLVAKVQEHRMNEAKQLLAELSEDQRAEIYARYNENISTHTLQMSAGKIRAGVMLAFLAWYTKDLWGEITDKDIVEFVSKTTSIT